MTAVLTWIGWSAGSFHPATLISRVDVIATLLILALMPRLIRRKFGAVSRRWLARTARLAGCLLVLGLVLVQAHVDQVEYGHPGGRPGLGGLWVGEVTFLLMVAAYVAGLLAITSRRPPVRPVTLTIGCVAGLVLGVAIALARPLEGPLHTRSGWVTGAYMAAKTLAVPLVIAAVVAAGITAARRTPRLGGPHARADAQGRQGLAAGLCAGAAAALVVSIVGLSAIALAPQVARDMQWTLPSQDLRVTSMDQFEASFTYAGAGYLLVLVLFPLFGAGLGACGGLYIAENSGRRPDGDGGGGGGPEGPKPKPKPPRGGLELGPEPGSPALDIRRILELPPWAGTPSEEPRTPQRRERTPAGTLNSELLRNR
jgi:hypothetical protein